jgi:hypothetical protein
MLTKKWSCDNSKFCPHNLPAGTVKPQQTSIRTVDVLAIPAQKAEALPFDWSSSVTEEILQTVTVYLESHYQYLVQNNL